MARLGKAVPLVFHEHPEQGGECLRGAFAAYVERIPVDAFADLDAVWAAVRARPFEADMGDTWGACAMAPCPVPREPSGATDARCQPMQRSRIWPDAMNCWEATAHFVAGALRFLPPVYQVHVWDRDLASGVRHVWPSLVSPDGHHLLVDLQTASPRDYPARGYTGAAAPRRAANGDEWYNHILGGLHVAGDTVLKFYGMNEAAKALEGVEGEALPDWSRRHGPPAAGGNKKPGASPAPSGGSTGGPKRAKRSFLGQVGTPERPIRVRRGEEY